MGEKGLPALHSAIPTKRNINDNNFAQQALASISTVMLDSYFEFLTKTVYRPRPAIVLS